MSTAKEMLETWIEREFSGHGRAVRAQWESPIPGEPFMSMEDAKELVRRAIAEFVAQADIDTIDQLRIERDIAQSACTAWRHVFEGIEAHLQDRIAMGDPAKPEAYLSIIRSAVANIDRDSQAIVNSRWTDSACNQRHIARLESELTALRTLPSSDQCVAIPAGIYFDVANSNFYSLERGCGCGLQFFGEWRSRAAEFPQSKEAAIALMPKWLDMKSAPRNATEIILKIPTGRWPGYYAQIGHWAEMDGSEQPPAKGWFRNTGHGFVELTEPVGWRWPLMIPPPRPDALRRAASDQCVAREARAVTIEECARVCDKHAKWAEDLIEDNPESKRSQIFAGISNTANDCAEMIRDLLSASPSSDQCVAREALENLLKAAKAMPRETLKPGSASTLHDFQIEAANVWSLDRACKDAEAALTNPAPTELEGE